ncbi:putative acetyltransferase [Glaciibacter psychrotolerans]|uniref:Histone acetyltransferase Rv0428c-like SH3 domain-containing protein n=1 Tax=Glaciibacter psychrotolerans TaxID=670054 RepID=A0A7Z0EFI0_9MICO|nr:ferrous iron transport protein A [Leifsonia psychrotolerans]NYJ20506.1 hypothetical protein [Leifsonia psychrotolerans]
MTAGPLDFLKSAAVGTRVVVRQRIPGGFTDALGYLRALDDTACVVETKRGMVRVILADVVAAKPVPPPPERRGVQGASRAP